MPATRISTNVGPGGSTGMPSYQAGDLIIVFAFRNDSSMPATPSGYTSFATNTFGARNWRLSYKIATASETVPSYAAAVVMAITTYRDHDGLGGFATADGNSSSLFNYPTFTFDRGDGTSRVLAFMGVNQTAGVGAGAPPAPFSLIEQGTSTGVRAVFNESTPMASFAGLTYAQSSGGAGWSDIVVEIKAAVTADASITEKDDTAAWQADRDRLGDVSYTEAVETTTSNLDLLIKGSVTYTEALDTTSSDMDLLIRGNVAYSEASDTGSGTIVLTRLLNVSYTEALDTVTSELDLFLSGSTSYVEALDTTASFVEMPIDASFTVTEQDDIGAWVLEPDKIAYVTYTEAADTAAGLILMERFANATLTELDDVGEWYLQRDTELRVEYTEAADTTASAAVIFITGSVTYTEAVETTISDAEVYITASASYTEAIDTASAIIQLTRIGFVDYVEDADTVTSAGDLMIAATVNYTEASETVSSSTALAVEASAVITEQDDVGAWELDRDTEVRVSYTEAVETTTSLLEKERSLTVTYTENADTSTGVLKYGIRANVAYTEIADTAAGYITGVVSASAVLTEQDDIGEWVLDPDTTVSVVYTEADDTVIGEFEKELGATVEYVERSDTVVAFYSRDNVAEIVYTEKGDTVTSNLDLKISARVVYIEVADTVTSAPVADERQCCAPRLCSITPSALVCNFINLLPTGPLWDRAKERAIAHYVKCWNDPAPAPCPIDPDTCSSVVVHSIYTAHRLYDLLQNGLWPALRESDPNTAYTTIDDWLARYRWVDCFYGVCRDPDLGNLTPLEFKSNCHTYYCQPETPDDLLLATKHAIVVALSRLQRGIFSRVDDINWVIAPLGARLQYNAFEGTGCPISFDLVPISDYISSWHLQTCERVDNPPIPAWFNPTDCYNRGLPSKIWPGLMAAECIARSVMQRNQGIVINRKGC